MTCGPKTPKCLREGAQLPVLESEELPVSRDGWLKRSSVGGGLIEKRAENRNKLRLQKILALSPVGSEWLIAKGLWYALLEAVWSCDDYL